MLELFMGYLAFALATAFVSWLYLFWPCVRLAREFGINNEITQSPVLTSIVWFIINTGLAPLTFFIVLIPSFHQAALEGVRRSVFDDNK